MCFRIISLRTGRNAGRIVRRSGGGIHRRSVVRTCARGTASNLNRELDGEIPETEGNKNSKKKKKVI